MARAQRLPPKAPPSHEAKRSAAAAAALQAGAVHERAGRLVAAAESYGQAARLAPKNPDAHYNFGTVLQRLDRIEDAVCAYRVALSLAPDDADALENIEVALRRLGRNGEAEDALNRLLAIDPDNAAAHNNLGLVLLARGEAEAAAAEFERALALAPDLFQARNNHGNARLALGDRDGAEAAYRAAIARDPGHAEARANLGNLLRLEGRIEEALEHNRCAAALAPARREMHEGLGQTLAQSGDYAGAVAALARAIEIDPGYVEAEARLLAARQQGCDWDGLDASRAALIAHVRDRIATGRDCGIEPHFALTLVDDPEFHKDVAASRARKVERETAALGARTHFEHPRATPSRLRIGYVSSHFGDAPTAHLMAGLLEKHDRARFGVFGYALGADDGSAYRRRIEAACDRFAELRHLTTEEAARRIQADGVHVLIDLRGYAQGGRPAIFALRPSPVQAQLVGFAGTMAAPFIDYLIADAFVAPESTAARFTEALVTMPGSYLPTDDRQAIAPAPSRAECGLPEGATVYCCFNTNYKIEPVIFSAWMEILRAVPDSVLWLIRSNPTAERNLRRAAEAEGIAAKRLIFAERWAKPRHLARHAHADLFLDSHFVNAHTTAVDALWAGLPVLTWPGESFVARVGASAVAASGLDELIAADRRSYVAMAVALGRDRAALASLKRRLAECRSSAKLFDTAGYARRLEWAFAEMWRRFAAGLPPGPIAVPDRP